MYLVVCPWIKHSRGIWFGLWSPSSMSCLQVMEYFEAFERPLAAQETQHQNWILLFPLCLKNTPCQLALLFSRFSPSQHPSSRQALTPPPLGSRRELKKKKWENSWVEIKKSLIGKAENVHKKQSRARNAFISSLGQAGVQWLEKPNTITLNVPPSSPSFIVSLICMVWNIPWISCVISPLLVRLYPTYWWDGMRSRKGLSSV